MTFVTDSCFMAEQYAKHPHRNVSFAVCRNSAKRIYRVLQEKPLSEKTAAFVIYGLSDNYRVWFVQIFCGFVSKSRFVSQISFIALRASSK